MDTSPIAHLDLISVCMTKTEYLLVQFFLLNISTWHAHAFVDKHTSVRASKLLAQFDN